MSVESTIAVFVKHLAEDEVTISDDAITIEVEADIGYPLLAPVLIDGSESLGRLGAALPPGRNFDFLTKSSQSVIQRSLSRVFPTRLLVQTLVIKAEGLMCRAVE